MDTTLQHIFTSDFSRYAKGNSLPYKYYKAANAIMSCRTAALGGHLYGCPDKHEQHVHYNSCKHRSCPLCSALPKARWVDSQRARILDCDHYHVICTLPHELLSLWEYNRYWFSDALFQTCRDTLMTLLKDPKHLGAEPGIIMALHTWGRSLSLHPHMHCLVTGGGLGVDQHWRGVKYNYLLPIAVVKSLYKGKFLARLWNALNAGRLTIPPWQTLSATQRLFRKLNTKSWNVHIQKRYAHGKGVMLYLGRYVKGGAISNTRIEKVTSHSVTFNYKDHHDQKHKLLTLTRRQFMDRVLWHVPEMGQHTVRHYGLYSHHSRNKRNICRQQLGQGPEPEKAAPIDWQRFLADIGQEAKVKCSQCGQALLRFHTIGAMRRYDKNSISSHFASVQQVVEDGRRRIGGSERLLI